MTGRDGKLIAVANMKGGVGKTTTVVSLAEAFAADDLGAAVLVVDLDPQASASMCLAGDQVLTEMIEQGRTLQDFLEMRLFEPGRGKPLASFIRSHYSYTLHRNAALDIALLPCGPGLRAFEREVIYKYTKQNYSMNAIEGRLWKMFEAYFAPLRETYDVVIFDCPPGISPFTEVAIRASDMTIVPTIPDEISNFGLNAFCAEIWTSSLTSLPVPPKPFVLPTHVKIMTRQHRSMLARFEKEAGEPDAAFRLLKTRIPQAAALAEALVSDGVTTFNKKYGDTIVGHLAGLTGEIKEVLHAARH